MSAARVSGCPLFYTSSWDTKIKVWDCKTLECLRELKGYEPLFTPRLGKTRIFVLFLREKFAIHFRIISCSPDNPSDRYHRDAISGLALLWSFSENAWELWTSSWDKHFCVFRLKVVIISYSAHCPSSLAAALSAVPRGRSREQRKGRKERGREGARRGESRRRQEQGREWAGLA